MPVCRRNLIDMQYECPCAEGSHTLNLKDENDRFVDDMIQEYGEEVPVTVGQIGTFLVPRIYIIKHGIKGKTLPDLGFPRV